MLSNVLFHPTNSLKPQRILQKVTEIIHIWEAGTSEFFAILSVIFVRPTVQKPFEW